MTDRITELTKAIERSCDNLEASLSRLEDLQGADAGNLLAPASPTIQGGRHR